VRSGARVRTCVCWQARRCETANNKHTTRYRRITDCGSECEKNNSQTTIKPITMRMRSSAFRALAYEAIICRRPSSSRKENDKRFHAYFGCSPKIVAFLWNRSYRKKTIPHGFRPTHMLWTLAFLKLYQGGTVMATLCKCDEKTLRKWVWKGINMLSDLGMVSH
jgi:hypothetical protein